MQQVFDFISAFTQITEEESSALRKMMNFSSFKKNEILHRSGEITKRVAFVLKGAVRVYYFGSNGEEHTVGFIFENQPIGAFESFSLQAPSSFNVITLEPTDLLWIDYVSFFTFLENYPHYETVIRAMLSMYMHIESEHSRLLRINSSRDRYNAFCESQPEVLKRVRLKYIASYLNMTLETLSRVRAGKL
jgi:CRP-like cAMP-binding protein